MPAEARPTIAILGASGLIGEALALHLAQDGFPVVPIARRFTPAQRAAFGGTQIESPIVALDQVSLAQVLAERKIDIVVNCVGILQDGPRGGADDVHRLFVERLVETLCARKNASLLIHISIPGNSDEDRTPFSRTKREAEQAITSSSVPFIILRPGFVIASAAYGGSALMRALAVLPFDLPTRQSAQHFATTDIVDIARTVALVSRRWQSGERTWKDVWDVMAREPTTVGDVLGTFRRRLGGPRVRWRPPAWLMTLGARSGDVIAWLGWEPPIRSTALREIRRGVTGDPQSWIASTSIEPNSLAATLQRLPASVQERWFARLYFLKALVLTTLACFWIVSGVLGLTVASAAAAAVLASHGISPSVAHSITIGGSLADIAIGLLIAFRRASRIGLIAGLGLSLAYMMGASAVAPDLWLDPLGPIVKIVPVIVLMLVALAVLENR